MEDNSREMIYVVKSSLPPIDEYVNEIKDIWESHWLTNMGKKHQRLQCELKEYLGVEQLDLLTNGHMALELSIQAMNITEGEIITTPFTFASTTHAIVRNGITPVFCDINADDFCINPSLIEKLITKNTKAIMPVHVYGNVCDVEAIQDIANKYGLKVIYDAAHVFGVRYKDKGVSSFGDVSCLSFHATKVFNSIEGGAACFKNEEFGKKLYQLKNFGIKDEVTVDGIGANAKMNEFCAAMGLCNLKYIDECIQRRKVVADRYCERLEGIKGIQLNKSQKDVKPNYAYYPIIVKQDECQITRDEIYTELKKHNIIARKYFYPITSEFDVYKERFNKDKTPIALETSRQVLTLPIYPELALEDVDRICDIIVKKVKNG